MADIPDLTRLERRDTDMQLTYSDGGEFTVTYDDLKHACPCAKCAPLRNDDGNSKTLRRQIEAMAPEKPQVRTVGKYALAFDWKTDAQVVFIALSGYGLWLTIKIQITVNHTCTEHGKATK